VRLRSMLPSAGLIGLVALSGCTAIRGVVSEPTVRFRSLEPASITFDGVTADVHFDVANPNSFAIRIESYTYNAKIGSHMVASGVGDRAFEIAAHGTTGVAAPVAVRFAELASMADSLPDAEAWPYSVEGTLKVGAGPLSGIEVDFSHTGEIPRPLPPSISVEELSTRSLSLDGAEFDVALRVGADGVNSYTLRSFIGAIEIAGRRVLSINVPAGASPATASPGTGAQVVRLTVRVGFADLAHGLGEAAASGHFRYRLVGDATVVHERFGAMPLKLDEAGTVGLGR
jgi:LEA14-like dessication related protein